MILLNRRNSVILQDAVKVIYELEKCIVQLQVDVVYLQHQINGKSKIDRYTDITQKVVTNTIPGGILEENQKLKAIVAELVDYVYKDNK